MTALLEAVRAGDTRGASAAGVDLVTASVCADEPKRRAPTWLEQLKLELEEHSFATVDVTARAQAAGRAVEADEHRRAFGGEADLGGESGPQPLAAPPARGRQVALNHEFRTMPIFQAVRDGIGNTLSQLQEGIAGVRVVQAFGREDVEAERFELRLTRRSADTGTGVGVGVGDGEGDGRECDAHADPDHAPAHIGHGERGEQCGDQPTARRPGRIGDVLLAHGPVPP